MTGSRATSTDNKITENFNETTRNQLIQAMEKKLGSKIPDFLSEWKTNYAENAMEELRAFYWKPFRNDYEETLETIQTYANDHQDLNLMQERYLKIWQTLSQRIKGYLQGKVIDFAEEIDDINMMIMTSEHIKELYSTKLILITNIKELTEEAKTISQMVHLQDILHQCAKELGIHFYYDSEEDESTEVLSPYDSPSHSPVEYKKIENSPTESSDDIVFPEHISHTDDETSLSDSPMSLWRRKRTPQKPVSLDSSLPVPELKRG